MEHKICLATCIVTKPHLGEVCISFTNTAKVGAVCLTHCCVVILVVGIIIDYVFIKTLLTLKQKDYKNWGPKILAILSLQ